MDTNDLLYNQIEILTRQNKQLFNLIEALESRSEYYESVLLTLIKGLKNAGIIIDNENGENEMPS